MAIKTIRNIIRTNIERGRATVCATRTSKTSSQWTFQRFSSHAPHGQQKSRDSTSPASPRPHFGEFGAQSSHTGDRSKSITHLGRVAELAKGPVSVIRCRRFCAMQPVFVFVTHVNASDAVRGLKATVPSVCHLCAILRAIESGASTQNPSPKRTAPVSWRLAWAWAWSVS